MGKTILVFLFSMLSALPSLTFAAAATAAEGYQDHLLTLNRKPYPSLDELRNAQR